MSSHTGFGTVCVVDYAHDWADKAEHEMPPRPLRATAPGALPSRVETEAATKVQAWYKRRIAMKLRKSLIEDERIIAEGTGTVLQGGHPYPVTFEFRQAMFKVPWKLQQYGNRALINKRTTVRLTLTNDWVQLKTWGGGMDMIMTEPLNQKK